MGIIEGVGIGVGGGVGVGSGAGVAVGCGVEVGRGVDVGVGVGSAGEEQAASSMMDRSMGKTVTDIRIGISYNGNESMSSRG